MQDIEYVGNTTDCSDLTGSLAVNGSVQPMGVTQFSNEACDSVEALAPYAFSQYLSPEVALQDLKAYFERPRLIFQGPLAVTGNQANVVSATLSLANLQTWFPQWSNRLSGAYAIKFDTIFRLQVAATPFHQGVLSMGFQYGSPTYNTYKFVRVANPPASTNVAHVRLDLTELTMAELRVPFTYGLEFLPTSGADNLLTNIGQMGINQIVPIQSVAALAPPTYKVYVMLDNIELFGADNNTSTSITLQSGVMVKEAKQSKIISSSLTKAAEVSSFVARHIPFVSGVAGPTAWALDMAAGVARYFGYSRPLDAGPVVKVYRQTHAGEVNVDTPAVSTVLALTSANTLAFSKNFSVSDVDEMSLKFITSQFSQCCLARVTTGNVHTSVVYAAAVSPSVFWFRAPSTAPFCNIVAPSSTSSLITSSGNVFLPTSLMYISSFFRTWRGSIRFRFTFGKSKFHAGRYMVSFNPGTFGATTPGTARTTVDGPEVVSGIVQPYGYSQIMDLKDSNVFEFTVPYMNEQPYLTYQSSMGSISVVCIDPLQAPATVASSIAMLVEVAGGDDFELADYSGNYYPTIPKGTIYQQSGSLIPSPLLGSSTTTPCQDTVGECITSVKQMIQSPVYYTATIPAATGPTVPGTAVQNIPPWWYSQLSTNTGLDPPGLPIVFTASYTGSEYAPAFLASMYAFVRGSSDVHIYPTSSDNTLFHYTEQRPSEASTALVPASPNYSIRWNAAATPKVLNSGSLPTHLRFPSFQTFVRLPAAVLNGNLFSRLFTAATPTTTIPALAVSHLNRIVFNNSSTSTTVVNASFAAGDDAMCSIFMGPELVPIPNSAQIGSFNNNWFNTA